MQRLTSGISSLRNSFFKPSARSEHAQDFPISKTSIESLSRQIKNAKTLQLDLEELLILVKSMIVEVRKTKLKCNSIADINSILSETDSITQVVFKEIGQCVPRFRFALRLEYLKHAIGLGAQFDIDKYNILRNYPGFPGHKQIQHELIRCQIEKNLESDYNLPACRNIQRLAKRNISAINKAHYVQHCLNLLNLSLPISRECTEKMIIWCQENQLPRQLTPRLQAALHNQAPVHSVIADLLLLNQRLHGNHNTHPASRLLELSTGFVFHPNSTSNVNQLLNPKAPGAFHNIATLITENYLIAFSAGNTRHFFENAFVQQDPCFEATVENLLDFQPEKTTNQLTTPPIPQWTTLANAAQNIEAFLEWQEMVTLKNFVDANRLAVMANDFQKIEQLLDCKKFHAFILERKTEIFRALDPLIPCGLQHQLQKQFDARWP